MSYRRPRPRAKHHSKYPLKTKVDQWIGLHGLLVRRFLIVLGFFFLILPTIYRLTKNIPLSWQSPNSQIQKEPRTQTTPDYGPIKLNVDLLSGNEAKQPPLRIIIPQKNIDLSIVEAKVINGYWEISETTASHGIGSANPGEQGNVVVFAHARDNLFGPLRQSKPNEIIYILTKDRWHRYAIEETKIVDPTAIETIAQTKTEQLTLFTCSGFLDSKRLIIIAKPLYP